MAASQFDAQRAVRMDAEQLNEYMQELFNWSKDMKRRERAKLAQQAPAAASGEQQASGPAMERQQQQQQQQQQAPSSQQQQQQSNKSAGRHPAAHTYDHYSRKWDRFDVDAALAEDEAGASASASAAASTQQRQQSSGSAAPSSSSASQPVAIPQARVTVPVGPSKPAAASAAASGGAAPTTAEGWKDVGNAHFKRGQYREAVDCYSRSLELQPSCLGFANRAMARLKLGQAAEAAADCSQAVALDPLYVKAYQRRATARRQLGQLLGAVEDCESVLRLEPNNKQAAEDRAACVVALLQQEGLQPPGRTAWLPVVLASGADTSIGAGGSGSGTAERAPVKPAEVPGSAKLQAAAPAEPSAGDALISVAAVKRLKPAVAAAGAAAAVEPAAGGAASTASQQGAVEQPPLPAMPVAGASSGTTGDQAMFDAAEAQQVMPTAEQQPPAAQQPPAVQHAQPSVARAAAPAAAPPTTFKLPRTGLEFEKAWKGLKGDRQLQAAYLLALQPAALPTLLRQALSPGLLAAAAAALLRPGVQQAPVAAVGLLEGLARVPRFDLNLLSVPPRRRAELAADWDAAAATLPGQAGGEGTALAGRLAAVRQRYKL